MSAAVSCTLKTALDATGYGKDFISDLGLYSGQLQVLGSCMDSTGKRYDCAYDGKNDNLVVDPNGETAPTKDEMTLRNWGTSPGSDHFGHALSHLGHCKDSKGVAADVWFCQKDKKVLWDANPV